MIRDELKYFLKDSIVPKLEHALLDLESSRAREDERSQDLEREREARRKADKASADKEKVLADKVAEIARLCKEVEDARNTKATDKQNRFGSSSRKTRHSVDRITHDDNRDI